VPVGPFSRYRDLDPVEVVHASRGRTRSLPVRRLPTPDPGPGARRRRFTGYEPVDLLALRYLGREELYWWLLDANGGRLPDALTVGEPLLIPPLDLATRVERPGR
jgi:hypothetical protein